LRSSRPKRNSARAALRAAWRPPERAAWQKQSFCKVSVGNPRSTCKVSDRRPALLAVCALAAAVLCVTAPVGRAQDSAVAVEPQPPAGQAVVGEPLVLQARVTAPGVQGLGVEAVLITPDLQPLPVVLRDDGAAPDAAAGDGLWSGRFVPQEPGNYELNVTARGSAAGRAAAGRRGIAFPVARAARISLAEGLKRLDLGRAYPGEEVPITLTPVPEGGGQDDIAVSVTPLAGPAGAVIEPAAFKLSSASLAPGGAPAPFTAALTVPFEAVPGAYEGAIEFQSRRYRLVLPLCVQVESPVLRVEPAELDLGRILRGHSVSARVAIRLEGRGSQPVRVTLQPWQSPDAQTPGFYVEGLVKELRLKGDSTESLNVTVRVPERSQSGTYRSILLVETPHQQVRVPVLARAMRPPLPRRTVVLAALGVLAGLLLALLLWDVYRVLAGAPPSTMRRCLVASAFLHALALFLSTLVHVQHPQPLHEQRIAVRAVRLAGDGWLAGGQPDGRGSKLAELARVQEQAPDLKVAAAEDDAAGEKATSKAAEVKEA